MFGPGYVYNVDDTDNITGEIIEDTGASWQDIGQMCDFCRTENYCHAGNVVDLDMRLKEIGTTFPNSDDIFRDTVLLPSVGRISKTWTVVRRLPHQTSSCWYKLHFPCELIYYESTML